jgi:hypothetical protein
MSYVQDGDRGEPKIAFVLQAIGVEYPTFKDLYRDGATHWVERDDIPGDVVINFTSNTAVVWLPESRGQYQATNRTARSVFQSWCVNERERRARQTGALK